MADIKPISVPTKRLAASIDASASTLKLNNIKGWDDVDLTSSDLGTIAYLVLRNDTNTKIELIEIDPTTIASTSITINKRGLKFTGDLTTEVTANKLTWVKNETLVEIGSNPPQLLKHFVDILSVQTIGGKKTFSSVPDTSAGDPVAANDLVRKAYADALALGTLTNAPLVIPGNGGETLLIDQHVYLKESDQEWYLVDADTAATLENVLLGITRGAGTNGAAITGGVTILGEHVAASAIFTAGEVFASNTAGGFATSAGTKEVSLGIAKSTTKIDFFPRFNQQLTEDQQDALVGNLGTPSATDLFVNQSGLQKGSEIYAADAEANDTYVIALSPVLTAYATGQVFHFKANTANTGAATLNINSLGAKTIKKNHDQDLATGDIESGQIVTVIYDGTVFQMQSQIAGGTSADIQTFTSSGTYTKPAGAKKIHVQAWGGGGGSGGVESNGGSGGGGGGAFKDYIFEAGDVGSTETVTIGAGGTAGAAGNNNGGSGGNTTFGSLLTAAGGGGGKGDTNAGGDGGDGGAHGHDDQGTGATSGAGTAATKGGGGGGNGNGSGGGGVGAGGGSVYGGGAGGGGNYFGSAGGGGSSEFGGNGGAGANNGVGAAGTAPGGGAGGSGSNAAGTRTGAAGAAGQIIVTTYF